MGLQQRVFGALSGPRIIVRENGVWADDVSVPVGAGAILSAISAVPGTDIIFALGQSGNDHMFRREPGGASWTDLGDTVQTNAQDIAAISYDEAYWAVNKYVGHWTTAGGFSLFDASTVVAGTTGVLSIMAWPATGIIVASVVAGGPNVHVIRYDGFSWTARYGPEFGGPGIIHTFDGIEWFFTTTQEVHRSQDAGLTWASHATPPLGGSASLLNMWGSGPNDIWVSDNNSRLDHYNGTIWDQSFTSLGFDVLHLFGFSSTEVYGTIQSTNDIYAYDGVSAWNTVPISGGSSWVNTKRQLIGVGTLVTSKIQPYQVKGANETKQVETATQNGTEQFTLTTAAVANAGYPSGYEVQVFVGGIRQEYNASPGARQFRMVNATTVEVGGLIIGDTVAVVHGVD